jgi:hypothetical protein
VEIHAAHEKVVRQGPTDRYWSAVATRVSRFTTTSMATFRAARLALAHLMARAQVT